MNPRHIKARPITKKGWAVKWPSGRFDFYKTKKRANDEIGFWGTSLLRPNKLPYLFRCRIEEIEK